jgi:alpha-beta hydrolase superfamily lysophospholipase
MLRRIARILLIAGNAADADTAFWVLHLHGNADSAFSPWQVRHCKALRDAGFNVLDIDYRGFGETPGEPSEAAMYEDSEAAYQELLRRGVPQQLGFGGHVDALYEHVDILRATLASLVPSMQPLPQQ